MKKLISYLLLFSFCLSLVSCSDSASTTATTASQTAQTTVAETTEASKKLSGTLKVIATNESYKALFDKFAQDTGVKAEILSMSSGEVLSKLRAEGGTPSADLWFGGGIDSFIGAKNDGLLEQVNFKDADKIASDFKDKDNYYFSKGLTIVGFLFNNDLMKEKNLKYPETWDDLLDSQYKGEIIMSNPAISGTNYAAVNALLQNKKDGWDFLTKLNDNIAYYGKRGSDPKNKLVAGEFPIGITYIDGTIDAILEENNLSYVYPKDGVPWIPDGVAVFKNCENVEAAKYFVEWLFSNDENLRYLAEIDQKTTIKAIKPSLEGLSINFDENILMKEDLTLFGSEREEILAKYETLMGDKANNG